MQAQAIKSVRRLGQRKTLDFEVNHPDHNFYAEGVVVSNSHAYSYANLTAATTWLKANHPREFVFALLKLSRHEPDSQGVLNSIITESKQMGIAVLPPDITKSQADFSVEPDGVRFGLSHIRGISDTTMTKLTSFRRDFKNKWDIFDAAHEAKLTISVIVGLIYSGCISIPGTPRTKLAVEAQMYNLLTERERTLVASLGADYGHDLVKLIKDISTKVDEKGKPYIKESRLNTFRRDLKPYWNQYQANAKHEELATYLSERHYLGFSYSNTLFNLYAARTEGLIPVAEVVTLPKGTEVSFVAFIDEFKKGVGRESKKAYIRFHASEESGAVKFMLNGADKIGKCEQFNGALPDEGDCVIVHGVKADTGDMVFANNVIVQPCPIKLKKSGEVETAT